MKINIIFADRTEKKFECDDILYNEKMGAFILVTRHNGALNKVIIRSKQIRYFEFCGIDPIKDVCNFLGGYTCSRASLVDRAVHVLKPFIKKYFDEKGVGESTGKREKQIYIISFVHAVERGLLEYLDQLEDFNS